MKILKYLFFLFLIALIAGAIFIATKDGNYQLEETTIINAPVPVVFNEVNNLPNREDWDPWIDNAENPVISYSDTTSGEGAGFSWKSEDDGHGRVIIKRVIPNSSIAQEFTYKSAYGTSKNEVYWNFDEVEEGTKVTWRMEGTQGFRGKLASAFQDKTFTQMMRPFFSEGLENLKATTLEKIEAYSINVAGQTKHGGGFYMYTTTASRISQIPTKMQQMFTEISRYMEENNITQLGNPFVLYNERDRQKNTAIYSTGIFTPSLVITPSESDILNGMLPVQDVIKTTLNGNYTNLAEAWDAAYQYIEDNDLQVNEEGEPFEVYRVRPGDTQNPADWITEIYIPVQDNSSSME